MKKASGPSIKKLLEPYTIVENGITKISDKNADKAAQEIMAIYSGVYCQKVPVGIDAYQFSVISTASKKVFYKALIVDIDGI